MVSVGQICALMDFLEGHPNLARGHLSRSKEGRSLSARLWTECATVLNSHSAGCVQKNADQWRTYFNEYKSKLIKKIKLMKGELTATGGGPAKKWELTPYQERLYTLLGKDVGEPLPGVRQNPISTLLEEEEQQSPSIISNYVIYPASDEGTVAESEGVNLEPLPERTLEAEERGSRTPVVEHTTEVPEPRRRRRRQRREPRTVVEAGQPDSALRSATNTLENMEKLSSEATKQQADALREHAQAVREHAVAINRLAASLEIIGRNISSI